MLLIGSPTVQEGFLFLQSWEDGIVRNEILTVLVASPQRLAMRQAWTFQGEVLGDVPRAQDANCRLIS